MSQTGESSLVYSTYFGGNGVGDLNEVRKIALDSKSRVLLTGYTLSDSFPVTPDAIQWFDGDTGAADSWWAGIRQHTEIHTTFPHWQRQDADHAGLVESGLYQLNVTVPNLLNGDAAVAETIDGVSPNYATTDQGEGAG